MADLAYRCVVCELGEWREESQLPMYTLADLTESFIQNTEESSLLLEHFKEWTMQQP
jgi:hypothetical protein